MAREEGRSHPLRIVPAAVVQPTLQWRAVFAGLVMALLTYFILMALGMAVGGMGLGRVVSGGFSAERFGLGVAAWVSISLAIALFAGAFVASRMSALSVARVGRVQGLVVTGLFFGLLLSQLGAALGLGQTTIGGLGAAIEEVSRASEAQAVLADGLEGLSFREPPERVMANLSARLVAGDEEGAFTYLSRMAGITRAEASLRLDLVRADFQAAMRETGLQAAGALEVAGWTLLASLVLGSLAGAAGGAAGARANLRRPYVPMVRPAERSVA